MGWMHTILAAAALASAPANSQAAAPAPPQDEAAAAPVAVEAPAPTWPELLVSTLELAAKERHDDARVEAVAVRLDGTPEVGRWAAPDGGAGTLLRFSLKAAERHRLEYVVTPWRRLTWRGSALERPRVLTVTDRLIVLGPLDRTDDEVRADTFALDMHRLLRDALSADAANRGPRLPTSDTDWLVQRPLSLHVERQVPAAVAAPSTVTFLQELGWDWAAQERVIIVEVAFMGGGSGSEEGPSGASHPPEDSGARPAVDDSYRRVEIHAPGDVVRERPRPRNPDEQRLAVDVDLDAADAALDEGLRRVFGDVLAEQLADDDRDAAADPVTRAVRRRLEEVVTAHPARSGPARAAADAVVDRAAADLRRMVGEGRLPPLDEDHWPDTLTAYDPSILDELVLLPPPTLDMLPSLAMEFVRLRRESAADPGRFSNELSQADRDRLGIERVYQPTRAELLLAEVGDRIRTVARRTGAREVRTALREAGVDKSDRMYRAFRFAVSGPGPGDDRHVVDVITLSLDLR